MTQNFSVVIPTHNRSDLLAATLDCILLQELAPSEVIVVDDGSTDDTPEMLARYASRGVRHIRTENGGHLAARNIGLRQARADLVAFCDSDDLWHPSFLAAADRLWTAAPTLEIAYANFAIIRGGEWSRDTKFDAAPAGYWHGIRTLAPGLAMLERPFADRVIDYQPFFPTGMIVARNAFIARGGWDEGVTGIVGCDLATVLNVSTKPPVGLIQRPLVGIRKHQTNISANAETMNLGNAKVLEYALRTRPALAPHAAKILASIAARRRDALASAFARHDMTAVRRIYDLLPARFRTPGTRLKASLAALPKPLSASVNGAALWLGTSKASIAAMTTAKLHHNPAHHPRPARVQLTRGLEALPTLQ